MARVLLRILLVVGIASMLVGALGLWYVHLAGIDPPRHSTPLTPRTR